MPRDARSTEFTLLTVVGVTALSTLAMIIYPAAGHFMFADEPQRFAADVAAFVAKASR